MRQSLKRSFQVLAGLFVLFFIGASARAQVEPDSVRQAAWQQFQDANGPQWEMRWHARTGAPRSIHGGVTKPFPGPPEAAARAFLAQYQDLFKMKQGLRDLKLIRVDTLRGIRHVRFQQTHRGVPVYEGQYLVHIREDGRVDMANGHYYPDLDVQTTPSVSETAARSIATSDLEAERELRGDVAHELIIYPRDDGSFRLAWKAIVPARGGSWRYFIDAQSGRILEKLNLATSIVGTEEATVGKEAVTSGNKRAFVVGTGDIIEDHPGLTPTPVSRNFYRLDGSGYLRGTYANVHNDVNSRAFSSTNSFHYSTTDTHFDEANVYYHIDTYRADYLDNLGFNSDIGSDQDLEAWVHDVTEKPNSAGYYPGDEEVRFGNNFDFAKEDKIIYHEFIHAVTDVVNGGIDPTHDEEGAIGEGNADYFAGSYTGRTKILDHAVPFAERDMANPDIASYSGYQNHPDYPSVEEHDGGEFWSAVLWDLRSASGISVAEADHLIYAGISRVSSNPDFQEYRSAILAEDNSVYGGQHECAIKEAFYDRGIGSLCAPSVQITSGPLKVDEGQSGTWTASASGGSGSYTYIWRKRRRSGDPWYGACAGAGATCTTTFSEDADGNNDAGGIRVIVSDDVYNTSDTYTRPITIVDDEGGGGCNAISTNEICLSAQKQAAELGAKALPDTVQIGEVAPTPTRTRARLEVAVPQSSEVRVAVYNTLGRRVQQTRTRLSAGWHAVPVDVTRLSSGMYFARVTVGTTTKTRRLIVVR